MMSGETFPLIVDVDTRKTIGPNADGELLVKSPCVLKGYWNNEQATSDVFDENGWFKTGDVGHYDEDGNVYIVDRIKDMMKYKGHSVAPAELESVLLLHPSVLEAAVVAVKDETVGDLPMAYITSKTQSVSTTDIINFVNERVAPYKRLRAGLRVVQNIPRGPSGKVLRRLLRETEEAKL